MILVLPPFLQGNKTQEREAELVIKGMKIA